MHCPYDSAVVEAAPSCEIWSKRSGSLKPDDAHATYAQKLDRKSFPIDFETKEKQERNERQCNDEQLLTE